jgi:hypothetical protein
VSKIITVNVDFQEVPLEVEAEYFGGEAALSGPLEWSRPEYAPAAIACRVLCHGTDIMQLLSPAQLRDIENRVVTACSN